MANTFKVVTKAGVTSADTIYTVASSTTTVVLGIMVGNTTTTQITATVSLGSDTSNRAGANDEANQTVELLSQPLIIQEAEILKATAATGDRLHVVLSVLQINRN